VIDGPTANAWPGHTAAITAPQTTSPPTAWVTTEIPIRLRMVPLLALMWSGRALKGWPGAIL
jgi:hypothetical protein